MSERRRVSVVLVAYNRRDLLTEALDALAAQSRPVDEVVVLDNCSEDDSATVAADHPVGARVITLDRNTGGAGGFAAGIAAALDVPADRAPDWVWLMDDDTIPTEDALAELLRAADSYEGPVALLGSRVVWHDGRDHPMNTPRKRPRVSGELMDVADRAGARPVRSSSFVSMLVNAKAVRYHGLPIADYFIWNDDFEYSCRLLRRGTGLYVPGSVVEHRTKTFGATDTDPGPRFYYEVRNKIWMFTRSAALSGPERVLYTGAALRRWVRTFARSENRGVLASAALRGLRDGVLGAPRPTTAVLSGLPVSAAVARVEGRRS
ncbi:glycosyltransferase [Sanguibacter sp. Leaf3]|uniref:glycosyltransferase n=1 Tax=Sanguibacter sp. Leaf3 TaxID=1736209 RepID=UPI0006F7F74D|nr:glycosyltransferase [Sanguibacter sp. Leaf3]KQT96034.1 glycosyl transferase [Sanguibacter sp. Leaf3]